MKRTRVTIKTYDPWLPFAPPVSKKVRTSLVQLLACFPFYCRLEPRK